MEDIKNIESAKARGETLRKSMANKRRNKKYTPGFIEMAVTFLNKTPAEAGLFDASPKSAKGRAATKKKKEAKKNLDRDIVKAREKRDINLIVNRAEKAQKKADDSKGRDKPKGDKKFNVGVSKGGVPFKEAFAHFRKKGDKTFTWNGKKYTTELAKPKGKK